MRAAWLIFACGILLPAMPVQGNELTNGRITIDFATGGSRTMDRVDSVTWVNSNGVQSGNFAVQGGAVNCGDPSEFFGESYGDVDGSALLMVTQGANAKWSSTSQTTGTSKTTGKDACFTLTGRTTTVYTLYTAAKKVSEMTIKRTFDFTGDVANNLRAYTPRVSDVIFANLLYPDSTGAVQSINIFNCPVAQSCEISDWNGKWFADDDGQGNGIVMIRDRSSTWPAEIAGDFDGSSSSNTTSILLIRPGTGWSGKIVETEHLCFYDATSWPAAKRNAGKLPVGCAASTP